jgi:peptide/nickel transport system ATP-binding protein
MSCLHIRRLSVFFPTQTGVVTAVDGISFDHIGGETLALMGETGCGKSVIANAIMRLLPGNAVVEGEIQFKGTDLLKADEEHLNAIRGRDIAIVFQNPSLALNPIHTIGSQIAEPLLVHTEMGKKQALPVAQRLLDQLGFDKLERSMGAYPFQFSGGMNQRAIIAASMVLSPSILIADEPTKGLDYALRDDVMQELSDIKTQNSSSLLLITHDFDLSRRVADRTAIMYAGEILEIAPTTSFFHEPLHPYSRALLRSLPENGFQPIPGPPVAMTDQPPGCKFHPRCPEQQARCSERKPPSITLDNREIRCFLYA